MADRLIQESQELRATSARLRADNQRRRERRSRTDSDDVEQRIIDEHEAAIGDGAPSSFGPQAD